MSSTFPTQTPPGELAPTTPRSEHTGARPAAPTWQPGDPLHAPSSYRQGLFTFREQYEDSWTDAATWVADPAKQPVDRHLPRDHDELADFIDDWHAWDRAGRPEVTLAETPCPELGGMVLFSTTIAHALRAAQEDEAAANRLRAALAEPPRNMAWVTGTVRG